MVKYTGNPYFCYMLFGVGNHEVSYINKEENWNEQNQNYR
jgi:hypothetical protein